MLGVHAANSDDGYAAPDDCGDIKCSLVLAIKPHMILIVSTRSG